QQRPEWGSAPASAGRTGSVQRRTPAVDLSHGGVMGPSERWSTVAVACGSASELPIPGGGGSAEERAARGGVWQRSSGAGHAPNLGFPPSCLLLGVKVALRSGRRQSR
ncbi:unnamed protein product, partial [Urochloa humidicola]